MKFGWIALLAAGLMLQTTGSQDPVTVLQKKINSGAVKLEYDEAHGYLKSLLKLLNIPVSSQTLVFGKNSFQLFLISPENPRAIYFNDDTYVGWTKQGSDIEVAATDPKAGPVFYTLPQTRAARPKFKLEPEVNCLVCHDFMTSNKPLSRLLMLSVLPDFEGRAIGAGALVTNDQSPFRERWGSWYVTGTAGDQAHLGNKTFDIPATQKVDLKDFAAHRDLSRGLNVTDLSAHFDTSRFLTPDSDIVALMILGHQTHIHNLMTLAASTKSDSTAESLVKAMLFSGAEPFTSPVKGTSSFAADFSKRGPADSRGRSLYQLDLQRRLLKYPLSYLIYSPTFDALPPTVHSYVVRRLREILTGTDASPEFAHLSSEDRQAILEIVRATKPGLI